MSFQYKNPISPNQLTGQQSIDRSKTYGTNYSILSTGGYMEVFSLEQLYYTIPPSTYGPIEYSGNSISITFSKGSGTTFSLDTLTLHPDNISSGRRKLGMLVYVYEENQVYQFNIDNYETLWNSATGSTGTTIISDFGTTIKADSVENIAFISGWTANTIDGVSGETYSTAVWKKYYGNNLSITGGSYNTFTGTLTLTNITGGTQSLTGFGGGGGGGSGITGGTFDKNTETLTLSSSGGSIYITGFTDIYTTGGTFNSGTNTLQLKDNSGNTISITGFSSTFTGNTSASCITDLYVTNVYGCSPINVNNLLIANSGITTDYFTASTISASTYYNLPTDIRVTGGTYSNNTFTFTNNTGGTFSTSFNTMTGLTATTISATTFNGDGSNLTGIVPTSRSISTTAPLSGGGDLSTNRTISITQSNTTTDGFLSSTDWNTFNGKQAPLVSGTNIRTVQSTTLLGSGDVTITDANLSTSDITTNNVSTSKHGFVPKATSGLDGATLEISGSSTVWVGMVYTVELIDALTVDFYAPYNLKINSVSNVLNSPTTTLLVGGSSYVLGNTITIGSKITVTVSVASVINLNVTKA